MLYQLLYFTSRFQANQILSKPDKLVLIVSNDDCKNCAAALISVNRLENDELKGFVKEGQQRKCATCSHEIRLLWFLWWKGVSPVTTKRNSK